MKLKLKYISFWALAIVFISCANEPIGGPGEIEETLHFTGLKCVGSGDYIVDTDNLLEDLVIPEDLPDSLDLSEFLPPIGNQGKQGSCGAWAVSYYMKSLQENLKLQEPLSPETTISTSPAYTYNQITQGNCGATTITQHLNILKEQGVCSLTAFPTQMPAVRYSLQIL